MGLVMLLSGITDLGVPCKGHLGILVYIFCELINQTEEGPDPPDVSRAPGLLVSFGALC